MSGVGRDTRRRGLGKGHLRPEESKVTGSGRRNTSVGVHVLDTRVSWESRSGSVCGPGFGRGVALEEVKVGRRRCTGVGGLTPDLDDSTNRVKQQILPVPNRCEKVRVQCACLYREGRLFSTVRTTKRFVNNLKSV